MSEKPKGLSHLWNEVKRRNVHRSLAIYAGTAFIILEACSLIFPRWGIPDWSIDLVLWILILGALINVIISETNRLAALLAATSIESIKTSRIEARSFEFINMYSIFILSGIQAHGKKREHFQQKRPQVLRIEGISLLYHPLFYAGYSLSAFSRVSGHP